MIPLDRPKAFRRESGPAKPRAARRDDRRHPLRHLADALGDRLAGLKEIPRFLTPRERKERKAMLQAQARQIAAEEASR